MIKLTAHCEQHIKKKNENSYIDKTQNRCGVRVSDLTTSLQVNEERAPQSTQQYRLFSGNVLTSTVLCRCTGSIINTKSISKSTHWMSFPVVHWNFALYIFVRKMRHFSAAFIYFNLFTDLIRINICVTS